jgi:hypothetical protein
MRKIKLPTWLWMIIFWIAVAVLQAQTASHTITIKIKKIHKPKQGGVADVVADSLYYKQEFDWSGKTIIVTSNDSTKTTADSILTIQDN